MNKTARKPASPRSKLRRAKTSRTSNGVFRVRGGQISPEERRKYDELRKLLAEWKAAAERMTPEERAKADAKFELLKKSMNEERARAGARPIFAD